MFLLFNIPFFFKKLSEASTVERRICIRVNELEQLEIVIKVMDKPLARA